MTRVKNTMPAVGGKETIKSIMAEGGRGRAAIANISAKHADVLCNIAENAAVYFPAMMDADPEQLLRCFIKSAQLGVVPNGTEAAIVPVTKNKKVGESWQKYQVPELWVMTQGARKKLEEHPEVEWFGAEVICEGDVLDLQPLSGKPPVLTIGDPLNRGEVQGVIAIAYRKNGQFIYHCISKADAEVRYRPSWMQNPTTEAQKKAAAQHYSVRGGQLDHDWLINCALKTLCRKLPPVDYTGTRIDLWSDSEKRQADAAPPPPEPPVVRAKIDDKSAEEEKPPTEGAASADDDPPLDPTQI